MAFVSITRSPVRSGPTIRDRVKAFLSPGRDPDAIFSGGPAELHGGMRDAAYKTNERPQAQGSLLSSDGAVENLERIQLMKEGRRMFENIAAVKGAEKVHSRFCSPIMWYAQSGDQDVDLILNRYIAKQMEADNFDLSQAHDLPASVGSAVIDWGIDGDVFANFITPRDSDRFRVQWIRAHRVGKKDKAIDVSAEISDSFKLRSPKRFTEHGGIILDSLNRRRAIKVYSENRNEGYLSKETSKPIPWSQVCQIYDPLKTDRFRETTRWQTAIPEMIDLEQTWRYLKATIKQQVASPIVEVNKEGKPKRANTRPSLDKNTTDTGKIDQKPLKEMIPGQFQYLRPGESLKDFTMQRPNATFFDAVEYLQRSGSWAIDMPYPFIFESKKISGGSLRLENNKAGSALGYSRSVVTKCMLNPWVRAKILEGIRLGELPFQPSQLSELANGRWAWPELPTADEKYRDQTTISLYESGLCSGQDVVSPKGTTIEAVQDQKAKEARRIAEIALQMHTDFPLIPLDWWIDRIGKVGPNGSTPYRFPSDVEEENNKAGKGGSDDTSRATAMLDGRLTGLENSVNIMRSDVRKTVEHQTELSEQLELAF